MTELGLTTWRMHPEPGGKWYLKGPHWHVCNDEGCGLEHVEYEPFKAFHAALEGTAGVSPRYGKKP